MTTGFGPRTLAVREHTGPEASERTRNPPKQLTPADLSERWGINQGTLQNWRFHRKGPEFLKISRHVRYRLEDVEKFEQQALVQTSSPELP
jgi:hypothetical protein